MHSVSYCWDPSPLQDAIARYDGVIQSLELARELLKSFQMMCSDVEKASRKQAKRERFERMQKEVSRTKELLRLQSLMDSMGDESIRQHFSEGTNGALVSLVPSV